MNILVKLWRGEYSLARSYWLFSVLGNAVLSIPVKLYEFAPADVQNGPIRYLALIYGLLILVYCFVVAVGVWRSANAYTKWSGWKYLAKIHSALSLIILLLVLFGVGRSYIDRIGTYGMYPCGVTEAKTSQECGARKLAKIAKFTVDKNKSEVFRTTTDLDTGKQEIAKLENCIVMDAKNWKCGKSPTAEVNQRGELDVTNYATIQMVDGNISVTNYEWLVKSGGVKIRELIVVMPEYRKN